MSVLEMLLTQAQALHQPITQLLCSTLAPSVISKKEFASWFSLSFSESCGKYSLILMHIYVSGIK